MCRRLKLMIFVFFASPVNFVIVFIQNQFLLNPRLKIKNSDHKVGKCLCLPWSSDWSRSRRVLIRFLSIRVRGRCLFSFERVSSSIVCLHHLQFSSIKVSTLRLIESPSDDRPRAAEKGRKQDGEEEASFLKTKNNFRSIKLIFQFTQVLIESKKMFESKSDQEWKRSDCKWPKTLSCTHAHRRLKGVSSNPLWFMNFGLFSSFTTHAYIIGSRVDTRKGMTSCSNSLVDFNLEPENLIFVSTSSTSSPNPESKAEIPNADAINRHTINRSYPAKGLIRQIPPRRPHRRRPRPRRAARPLRVRREKSVWWAWISLSTFWTTNKETHVWMKSFTHTSIGRKVVKSSLNTNPTKPMHSEVTTQVDLDKTEIYEHRQFVLKLYLQFHSHTRPPLARLRTLVDRRFSAIFAQRRECDRSAGKVESDSRHGPTAQSLFHQFIAQHVPGRTSVHWQEFGRNLSTVFACRMSLCRIGLLERTQFGRTDCHARLHHGFRHHAQGGECSHVWV